jgi:nitroreductase
MLSVIDTLEYHVSIRDYTDKKIPDELLEKILEAARRSPTSSNMQTYSIVVVKNQETKKELAKFAGGQKHVETCDTFIALCADISGVDKACQIHDKILAKSLETTLVATIDATLVGMSLCLAAESNGLGSVMIGGMRNNPKGVADLLALPKGVYVAFGLCLGWPASKTALKPRMKSELIIHREKYVERTSDDLIGYDKVLASFYRANGRESPDAAWTGVVAKQLENTKRPDLKNTLESMGFSLN